MLASVACAGGGRGGHIAGWGLKCQFLVQFRPCRTLPGSLKRRALTTALARGLAPPSVCHNEMISLMIVRLQVVGMPSFAHSQKPAHLAPAVPCSSKSSPRPTTQTAEHGAGKTPTRPAPADCYYEVTDAELWCAIAGGGRESPTDPHPPGGVRLHLEHPNQAGRTSKRVTTQLRVLYSLGNADSGCLCFFQALCNASQSASALGLDAWNELDCAGPLHGPSSTPGRMPKA